MKKIYILPIAMLFLVMTLVLVSAATTLNVPVTETNYTTLTWNCTTTTADCDECLNATLWYNVTGGTTGTQLGSAIVNDSKDDIHFSGSVDIESLADALTYNFTCRVSNDSEVDIAGSAGVTNVGIDNTVPSITVTTFFSEINLHRFTKYSTAISDATAGLDGTESCSITNPRSESTSVSTSASINEDIWDDTGIPGVYNLSCSATDTASNTNTVSTTFEVKTTGPPVKRDDGAVGILEKIKGLDNKVWIIVAIIAVIVLATKKKS